MSENFILWSPSVEPDSGQVSFFASQANLVSIKRGTREMVEEMLEGLGVSDARVKSWGIDYFLTDYLWDGESKDWESHWYATWEISVKLEGPILGRIKKSSLVRSKTFDLSSTEIAEMHFPARCVLVVNFKNATQANRAGQGLEAVGKLLKTNSRQPETDDVIKALTPETVEALMRARDGGSGTPSLEVRQRPAIPGQLIVSLGEFDKEFYSKGAKLAAAVSRVCHDLGGTTTFHEKNSG